MINTLLKKQRISFYNENTKLDGLIYFPNNTTPSFPVFILVPGLGGRKEWFTLLPYQICNRGYAVFTFDLSGHLPSEGKVDDKIMSDITTAISFIKSQPEINSEKIVLGGQCLGGFFVIHMAANNPDVKAVVAMSPTFLPKSESEDRKRGLFNFVMRKILESKTHSADIDEDSLYNLLKQPDLLQDISNISPRPILITHVLEDETLPLELVNHLYFRAGEPKELAMFEANGKHTAAYRNSQIAEKVGMWLDKITI